MSIPLLWKGLSMLASILNYSFAVIRSFQKFYFSCSSREFCEKHEEVFIWPQPTTVNCVQTLMMRKTNLMSCGLWQQLGTPTLPEGETFDTLHSMHGGATNDTPWSNCGLNLIHTNVKDSHSIKGIGICVHCYLKRSRKVWNIVEKWIPSYLQS